MNRRTDIYGVEYYLPKAINKATIKATSLKQPENKNFKILVQDHIKDKVYLVDA